MAGLSGQYLVADGEIELVPGRERRSVRVRNTGDRPIQVGSHFHFFEANRALAFDRAAAFGMRLDIPSGTAARFEPGDERDVPLVAFGGNRRAVGFNGLVNGDTMSDEARAAAMANVTAQGYADDGSSAL